MADYIARFRDRFAVWWRRMFPLMVTYYIFDLWFRTTSSHFYEVNTIITYATVPIVAAIIASIMVILVKIFYNPVGITFLLIVGFGVPYHYFGWWGVFFAFMFYSFIASIFVSAGESRDSIRVSSREIKEHFEEQKRQDEWNNSHEKHARDYDQWRSHNEPPR